MLDKKSKQLVEREEGNYNIEVVIIQQNRGQLYEAWIAYLIQ